jgi:hypothetical protein
MMTLNFGSGGNNGHGVLHGEHEPKKRSSLERWQGRNIVIDE